MKLFSLTQQQECCTFEAHAWLVPLESIHFTFALRLCESNARDFFPLHGIMKKLSFWKVDKSKGEDWRLKLWQCVYKMLCNQKQLKVDASVDNNSEKIQNWRNSSKSRRFFTFKSNINFLRSCLSYQHLNQYLFLRTRKKCSFYHHPFFRFMNHRWNALFSIWRPSRRTRRVWAWKIHVKNS